MRSAEGPPRVPPGRAAWSLEVESSGSGGRRAVAGRLQRDAINAAPATQPHRSGRRKYEMRNGWCGLGGGGGGTASGPEWRLDAAPPAYPARPGTAR